MTALTGSRFYEKALDLCINYGNSELSKSVAGKSFVLDWLTGLLKAQSVFFDTD